jgi:hypothetical protein
LPIVGQYYYDLIDNANVNLSAYVKCTEKNKREVRECKGNEEMKIDKSLETTFFFLIFK